MDLLDGFSRNPLEPAYGQEPSGAEASEAPAGWRSHPGGLVAIGHDGVGFHFDNEAPATGSGWSPSASPKPS